MYRPENLQENGVGGAKEEVTSPKRLLAGVSLTCIAIEITLLTNATPHFFL